MLLLTIMIANMIAGIVVDVVEVVEQVMLKPALGPQENGGARCDGRRAQLRDAARRCTLVRPQPALNSFTGVPARGFSTRRIMLRTSGTAFRTSSRMPGCVL